MKKGLIVLTMLLCLAAFAVTVVGNVRAQTSVTPGVHQGDNFFWTTYSNWISSNPYDSIPTDLQSVNQTISIELRVGEVNDSYVNTFTATYYPNQQASGERGTVNVNTGEVTDGGFVALIGANLNTGEIIHPQGSDGIYINQTTSWGGRPAVEIYISVHNATSGYTSSDDRIFDQATGIIEYEVQSSVDDGSVSGYTSTSSVTMTLRSSPWNEQTVPTPEFSPILALPIFIGATTLILIALKKKHMIAGNPAVNA